MPVQLRIFSPSFLHFSFFLSGNNIQEGREGKRKNKSRQCLCKFIELRGKIDVCWRKGRIYGHMLRCSAGWIMKKDVSFQTPPNTVDIHYLSIYLAAVIEWDMMTDSGVKGIKRNVNKW